MQGIESRLNRRNLDLRKNIVNKEGNLKLQLRSEKRYHSCKNLSLININAPFNN